MNKIIAAAINSIHLDTIINADSIQTISHQDISELRHPETGIIDISLVLFVSPQFLDRLHDS